MKKILTAGFIITVGTLTAVVISYAVSGTWSEPTQSPPNGNVSGLSSILQNGNLNIDGSVVAKDFLVSYTGVSGAATKSLTLYIDKDGDGYTPFQGDCDDTNVAIHPGVTPQYNSGKDYDCNGVVEYTNDITSTIPINNSQPATCNTGGTLVNLEGHITGYKCLSTSSSCGAGTTSNTCSTCAQYSSALTTLTTLPMTAKLRVCLDNNFASSAFPVRAVAIGTSGNAGSCGGTGEALALIAKSNYVLSSQQLANRFDKAVSGDWKVWCN